MDFIPEILGILAHPKRRQSLSQLLVGDSVLFHMRAEDARDSRVPVRLRPGFSKGQEGLNCLFFRWR